MKPVFHASQFTPTEWNSAEDKAKFANHFVRFVTGGFKYSVFPKWFYHRLSNMYGHIAHHNKAGFYDTWFSSPDRAVSFIERIEQHHAYGDPAYTYSDVEKALTEWMKTHSYQAIWWSVWWSGN